MRILPCGDAALLVELADLAAALALLRALQEHPMAGVCELIPAARTLLVRFEPWRMTAQELTATLLARRALITDDVKVTASGRLVEIPVHYNGADLEHVAQTLGITPREVIARHTSQPWHAAFAGFAPGFVYLAGHHFGQPIPRRDTPRTQVPAGSVALAGPFSAVYPGASPGGWQLIGQTELAMWDLQRDEPACVQPGFQVQFVDVGTRSRRTHLPGARVTESAMDLATSTTSPPAATLVSEPAITFVQAGLQALAQDGGRIGQSSRGISASGALDRGAMIRANQLVGNPPGTAVIENLMGQMTLRSHGRTTLAVTGADVMLQLQAADGQQWPLRSDRAIALDDGDTLVIGPARAGLRCTLAVRGGWQITPVLGSRSTDTLAGLGPPAISNGQRIPVGRIPAPMPLHPVALALPPAPPLPVAGDTITLRMALGPRTDWFTSNAVALLQSQPWQVTPRSDRVGIRLHGTHPLTRQRHDELPSEGMVAGALQVPPSGQPVLLLADHPLTGGYPVIAVLIHDDLDLAAQIPPGCTIRFQVVAPFHQTPSDHAARPEP